MVLLRHHIRPRGWILTGKRAEQAGLSVVDRHPDLSGNLASLMFLCVVRTADIELYMSLSCIIRCVSLVESGKGWPIRQVQSSLEFAECVGSGQREKEEKNSSGKQSLRWKVFKTIHILVGAEPSGQGAGGGCAGEANETDDDQPCE